MLSSSQSKSSRCDLFLNDHPKPLRCSLRLSLARQLSLNHHAKTSPQAIEMPPKPVADQFEKKGVDPRHHFPCPPVVPRPSRQDSPQAIEMPPKAVADQFEKKGNNDKAATCQE
jgi:hypothetical protein